MLTFSEYTAQDILADAHAAQPLLQLLPADATRETAHLRWFAARLDDELIGLGAMTADTVQALVVLPQYRRQGVGRMLVGQMAGAVAQQGGYLLYAVMDSVSIDTSVSADPSASAFAAKLGFEPVADAAGKWVLDLTNTAGLRQH